MKLNGILPESAVRHEERDTSSLIYRDGTGEFHLRGAVCWPVMVSGQYMGCAMVGGLDVRKNRIAVLAEATFAAIDTMFDPGTGLIESQGIGDFFNAAWTTFYVNRYFVEAGAMGNHDHFGVAVRASGSVQPQPRFLLVDPSGSYFPVMQQHLSAKRLVYPKGGMVHDQMSRLLAGGPDAATSHPVVRALGVLLTGFLEKPWRRGDLPYQVAAY